MRTLKISIYGKVHGVFFRATAKDKAVEFNINGTVRNAQDCVEIIAQGSEEDINKFLEFCKIGPEQAHIKDIKIEELTTDTKYTDFNIIY
tara:strand:+ start:697 stop:966 length:270 start_codon:yes stop_codon:yes gene_type:complete